MLALQPQPKKPFFDCPAMRGERDVSSARQELWRNGYGEGGREGGARLHMHPP